MNSSTGSLGSAKALSSRSLGMQIIQDRLLGNLTRLLHFELLLKLEPSDLLSGLKNGTLHQGVHHSELDGLVSGCRRARVEEENWARFSTIVRMGEAVEGEPRLRR